MARRTWIYNSDGTVKAELLDGQLVSGELPDNHGTHLSPTVQIFKSGYFEHIAPEPIYCGSKAELRHQCAAHNSHSDYAG
jgi:hypothetical protein